MARLLPVSLLLLLPTTRRNLALFTGRCLYVLVFVRAIGNELLVVVVLAATATVGPMPFANSAGSEGSNELSEHRTNERSFVVGRGLSLGRSLEAFQGAGRFFLGWVLFSFPLRSLVPLGSSHYLLLTTSACFMAATQAGKLVPRSLLRHSRFFPLPTLARLPAGPPASY